MSETNAKKPANPNSMVRLTVTLGAICAVCALLLGGVNALTKNRIFENQNAAKITAMRQLLPADSYEPAAYAGADGNILSAFKAGDAGYVVEVNCSGGSFSGTLSIMVGVNADGTVAGVEVLESGETSGLGAVAKEDASWRAQFVGKSGTVGVDKDGGDITAISGATITSRGVCGGVNAALAAVAELG